MPLVVDDREAEESSRLVSIRLVLLTLRYMENWRQLVDDCEKVLILLALAAINGERFTRGEALERELQDLRTTLPHDRLRYANISSVAAATGFNRETTRRKINELIEAGIVLRTSRGRLRFNPDTREVHRVVELVRRQLDVLVRAANDLMRDGVIIHS